MRVFVRRATPAEHERVGTLTVIAYQGLAVDHLFGGYDERIRDTETRAREAAVLVAVVDDRVVGSVTYVADSSSAWSEWTENQYTGLPEEWTGQSFLAHGWSPQPGESIQTP
jgi:hypothetical protein